MSSQALPQGHPSRPSWLMVIALIISPLVIAVFVSFFMHGMLFTILYLTPSVDTQMVEWYTWLMAEWFLEWELLNQPQQGIVRAEWLNIYKKVLKPL